MIDSKTVLFADDTSVIIGTGTKEQLRTAISNTVFTLQKWFSENDLKLNVEKTRLINFETRSDNVEFRVNLEGVELASSPQTSFLGIMLDNKLGWKQHVSLVVEKLAQFCYALRALAANADRDTCFVAYYAYVYSRLCYGVVVWGNSVDANRVFIMQKRTIRSIFGMRVRESCRPIFKRFKILTFTSIYILECTKFVRQNLQFFERHQRDHA